MQENAIDSSCFLQDTLSIISNKKNHPVDDILNCCLI